MHYLTWNSRYYWPTGSHDVYFVKIFDVSTSVISTRISEPHDMANNLRIYLTCIDEVLTMRMRWYAVIILCSMVKSVLCLPYAFQKRLK